MRRNHPGMEQPPTHSQPVPLKRLTIEDVYTGKVLDARSVREPHWMQDSKRFSYVDAAPGSKVQTLWMRDALAGELSVLVPEEALRLGADAPAGTEDSDHYLKIDGYQWSPDEQSILFAHLPERRSARGDKSLYVYSLVDSKLRAVSTFESEHRNSKWSPDGKRIGYVRDDEVYVLTLDTARAVRLTDTATATRYNGRFGWVYEEELGLVDGWCWSPDGSRIAYCHVAEDDVPQIDITDFTHLHMQPVTMRYPKAGDANPTVRVGLIETPDALAEDGTVPETRWIPIDRDQEGYIARVQWTPCGRLLIQWIPRLQNRIELLLVDPDTLATETILVETDEKWLSPPGDVTFVEGGFLWLSERTGYRHLFLYGLDGACLRQLTSGDWSVEGIAGVDAVGRRVLFTAAMPTPSERQILAVSLNGGEAERISDATGVHNPLASPDGSLLLNTWSNANMPPVTTVLSAAGVTVATILKNTATRRAAYDLAEWERLTIPAADGMMLEAMILKPLDFDPEKKYPAVMHIYGGPYSQSALDAYSGGRGLPQVLAAQGILSLIVDGRGGGGRGSDFAKITYLNLGRWEVHDQVQGANWLRAQPYIDPVRVGIWGWSYGGYMSLSCLLRSPDTFAAAVSVAPVTDWTLYDSIYTERYMQRPADNAEGYREGSVLTYADALKGDLLIMHGLADDNVHFQNTARIIERFQKSGKSFEMMAYPGKHHGIEGVSAHVYGLIVDFFVRKLG